jgi:hypothetical protein
MYLRLTGPVESCAEVAWASRDGSRSGKIPKAVIRLNDFITTEVALADALRGKVYEGDLVDLIVNVEASGGYVRATATGFWPRSADLAA